MRNTQAARYARWAVTIAILLAVIVAGVYLERTWRQYVAGHNVPPPVPKTVQQQSAEFSFSKVEQDRTLFTVHASRATQFKDQDRSRLEDVQITIYGQHGERNDVIRTHECNYEPETGRIICQGVVELDLENAEQARQGAAGRIVHVRTTNVSFDRGSGDASTTEPVDFRFPNGEGHGVGAVYSTADARVSLEHDVKLTFFQRGGPGSPPMTFAGRRLLYQRDGQTLRLFGPVHVQQGTREMTAGNMALEFDSDLRPRRALATGQPELDSAELSGQFRIAAEQFIALLSPAGWIEQVVAERSVRADRQGLDRKERLAAQRVEIAMEPQRNEPRQMTATGNVQVETQTGDKSSHLATAALRLQFVGNDHAKAGAERRRLESGETLAPATMETKSSSEATSMRANRFAAQFGARSQLEKLLGYSGVLVERHMGTGPAQTTTAQELAVTFDSHGDWALLEEAGGVRFRQGDRTAEAARARMARASDTIQLDGSPVVTDALTRTTAGQMEIHERSGDVRATGGVRTSYFAAGQKGGPDLGAGPAHISSDRLDAANPSGHAVYSGHARLWQGDTVIEGDVVELSRPEQRLEARGNVRAALPQAPGPEQKSSTPTLWNVSAPRLRYWSQENRALLDGGVSAQSSQGTLDSRTLEMFLSGGASASGRRQLMRALARGGVLVTQGDRRGSAEQAEYTAVDGKFVLSGGQPQLTDALGDTTRGHSLTFFVASDTILIDSQAGSRTLTEHRIEK
jgi:lipopolysaccharide export system protein LptA